MSWLVITIALLAAPRDGGAPKSAPVEMDAGVADGGTDGGAPDAGVTEPKAAERAALFDVVHAHTWEVHRCYTEALKRAPGLKGLVRVAWTVDADGRVSDARIDETDLDDMALQACVLERVRAWRFPKPADGTLKKLTWKWTLDPRARH